MTYQRYPLPIVIVRFDKCYGLLVTRQIRHPAIVSFSNTILASDYRHLTRRSFDNREEQLPLFDDICSGLGRISATDVILRINHSGWDKQDIAGLEWPAVVPDLITTSQRAAIMFSSIFKIFTY